MGFFSRVFGKQQDMRAWAQEGPNSEYQLPYRVQIADQWPYKFPTQYGNNSSVMQRQLDCWVPFEGMYDPGTLWFLGTNYQGNKSQTQFTGGAVTPPIGPIQVQALRSMTYQNMPLYGFGPGVLGPQGSE